MGKWDDPEYRKAYFATYNADHREERRVQRQAQHVKNRERDNAQSLEYAAAHREEARQRANAWYQSHQERGRATRHDWYIAHREEMRAYNRTYRIGHPKIRVLTEEQREAARKYHREYSQKHAELIREKVREWAKANPERAKQNAYHAQTRRHARLLGATIGTVNRAAIIARDHGFCGLCGEYVPPTEMSLDHITPLSRGGAHADYNLQVAHLRCNKLKGARLSG